MCLKLQYKNSEAFKSSLSHVHIEMKKCKSFCKIIVSQEKKISSNKPSQSKSEYVRPSKGQFLQ